jgi:hypothetical protein
MVGSVEMVVKMKPYTQDRECLFLRLISYIGLYVMKLPLPFERLWSTNDLPLA